ncbi:hypothetical protein [Aeromonas dhakensis]
MPARDSSQLYLSDKLLSAIRNRLTEMGIELEDRVGKTSWRRA